MPLSRILPLAPLGLVALLFGVPSLPVAGQSITVVSWGGSYGRAVNEGANIPFTEATGIRISVADYNGGLAQIRAQVEIGSIHWDVVDLEIADAVRGCDEGLLERIDIDRFPPGPDGTPPADDFAAESQTECGVGNLYWSTVFAYNDESFPGEKPATMADFFDLERFPGQRGMRRVPQVNLEFALIADGVPLDEVYTALRDAGGPGSGLRQARDDQGRGGLVGGGRAAAAAAGRRGGGHEHGVQRAHLQRPGDREPAVRDRLGRAAARRRAARDRGGDAEAG